MNKLVFALLIACLFNFGCAHTYQFGAIDQNIQSKSVEKSFSDLKLQLNTLKGKKVAIKMSGFETENTKDMISQKLIALLREREIEVVQDNSADLEMVVIAEVFGTVGVKDKLFEFLYDSSIRAAKTKLQVYFYDTATKKNVYSTYATGSSAWSETYLLGIFGPIVGEN